MRLAREAADRRLLTRYPDPDYVELRKTLAAALRVPANGVTIANGSVALIAAIVRAIAPRACVLAAPAFAEYPRALRASGCQVRLFPLAAARGFALDSDALLKMLDKYRPPVCVLTNPHNPSGALTTRSQMLRVLDGARRTKTLLVIDEAFMDYAPTETLVAEAVRSEHLVVLAVGDEVLRHAGLARRLCRVESTPGRPNRRTAATLARDDAGGQRGDGGDSGSRVRTAHVGGGWPTSADGCRRRWARRASPSTRPPPIFCCCGFQPRRRAPHVVRARLITDHGVVVRDCRSFEGLSNGRFIRVAVRRRDENERLVRALGSVLEGSNGVR